MALITERDVLVVRWIGEMFTVPVDVLGELLDRLAPGDAGARAARFGRVAYGPTRHQSRERLARKHCARLEGLGLVTRYRTRSDVWVVPTARGLRKVGLDWQVWEPTDWRFDHIEAVARLRLALESTYPEASWESERAIRARWHGSGARVRIADGAMRWTSDGSATGIELELHVKRPDRYAGVVVDRDPAWNTGVWWFTPPEHVELLRQRLDDAGNDGAHQVFPIPQGVAP